MLAANEEGIKEVELIMKELFTIAKYLTLKIKDNFNDLTIEKVEITYSSLTITFLKQDIKFIFTLSTHHLDIPWQIVTKIQKQNKVIGSVEKIVDNTYNYETNPRYEITPKLLGDIENTIDRLVDLIISDLKTVLPQVN